jgi:hypothetical protein
MILIYQFVKLWLLINLSVVESNRRGNEHH